MLHALGVPHLWLHKLLARVLGTQIICLLGLDLVHFSELISGSKILNETSRNILWFEVSEGRLLRTHTHLKSCISLATLMRAI